MSLLRTIQMTIEAVADEEFGRREVYLSKADYESVYRAYVDAVTVKGIYSERPTGEPIHIGTKRGTVVFLPSDDFWGATP